MSEELFYRWSDSTLGVVTDPDLAESLVERYVDLIVKDPISLERRNALIFDDESISWFRRYVEPDSLGSALNEVLTEFEADIRVVGYTPVTSIESRCDGALIPVDLFEPAAEMLLLVSDGGSASKDPRKLSGFLAARLVRQLEGDHLPLVPGSSYGNYDVLFVVDHVAHW